MNAGAYEQETKDVLVAAVAYDHEGTRLSSNADMKFAYRHCGAGDGLIFVEASSRAGRQFRRHRSAYEGDHGAPEKSQPIREKTGGSTFANPDPALSEDSKAWQLIDEIGGHGRIVGDAQCSQPCIAIS